MIELTNVAYKKGNRMARNISEMESGEEIRFWKPKSYEFIKALKSGGTGKTILMQDTTINEKFVCKKYDPEQKEYEEEFYTRFVDEIKIMYSVYNSNIVRIFYVGYLIKNLIEKYEIDCFKYSILLEKMITVNPDNRAGSFELLQKEIAE